MKIEGVTFVENAVKSMTKEEFIERHIKYPAGRHCPALSLIYGKHI